jgi:hypothetical protein
VSDLVRLFSEKPSYEELREEIDLRSLKFPSGTSIFENVNHEIHVEQARQVEYLELRSGKL